MLNDPWKTHLIQFAHRQHGQSPSLLTLPQTPKTILGRTIFKRSVMHPKISWLNKIQGKVYPNELMSQHTSLRVGGPADLFIIPKDIKDLQIIFSHAGELPIFILGEGTNLVVRDKGIRGIVVSIDEGFRWIGNPQFSKNDRGEEIATVEVGAGTKMSYLVKSLARYSLTGMEDLVGIPGSLGGALIMNAGADGTEICQIVKSVTRVTPDGNLETLNHDDLVFDYRKTTFPSSGGIIVKAELELKKGELIEIQNGIERHLNRRRQKQPLTLPNTGSVFKNPKEKAAGKLIEEAGLKGYRVGDAGVSIKHANFIVNHGMAKAEEVLKLIKQIQTAVKRDSGIHLDTEVIIVGDES